MSLSSSAPRYPLPSPLSPEQRAFHVADQRFRTLDTVCRHFPVNQRLSPEGKGFSPEYKRALEDRDRASLDLTTARGAMVRAGMARMARA